MAAPTFTGENEAAWNSNSSPRSQSTTVGAGEVLVVVGASEDGSTTLGTPSGGSLTYTLDESNVVASYSTTYAWTADSPSSQTFNLSLTATGGGQFGLNTLRFSSSDGIGASAKTNVASGAPSLNITTTQANSALVVIVADWNAGSGSRTWRAVNGITPAAAPGNGYEVSYAATGNYTVYVAYYPDAGAAGVKTVGLTAPSGQKYTIIAVEVLGTSGGGPITVDLAGGITPTGVTVRAVAKPFTGGATPAGALQRTLARLLAATVAPSGTLTRSTGKALTGATTPTGALATVRAFLIALSGAITPAGAVARRSGKPLGGGATPAGAVARTVGKAASGAAAPTGTLTRRIGKAVAGAVTPAGAVAAVRTRLLALAGAITPTGALRRHTGKAVDGATAPAGAVTKRTARALAGGVSPAGVVLKLLGRLLGGGTAPSGALNTAAGLPTTGSMHWAARTGPTAAPIDRTAPTARPDARTGPTMTGGS